MQESNEFDTVWEDIYQRGEQLNLYPYDSVVAFLMRRFGKKPQSINILEIGCGAGNNLWFAARQGFTVSGIDASASALAFARKRFEQDKLTGEFEVGSFTELPWGDSLFDVIIDRAASTNVGFETAKTVISQAHRVLKTGGLIYSEVFSDQSSSRGDKSQDGVLSNIRGPYSGAGQIYFYSKSELQQLYQHSWDLLELFHTQKAQYLEDGVELFAHWSLVAKKV
ncbi:MAG: methyltransferase domain-containing protein [Gammaproteobacteria bacterium]|nr:methyltransferase domain-containing protein [Gammaproteobacteria bacterium]